MVEEVHIQSGSCVYTVMGVSDEDCMIDFPTAELLDDNMLLLWSYLCAFRDLYKRYLHLYAATYEANDKGKTDHCSFDPPHVWL